MATCWLCKEPIKPKDIWLGGVRRKGHIWHIKCAFHNKNKKLGYGVTPPQKGKRKTKPWW